MPRLTLRTLLAYIDDTLGPVETRTLGRKVAASEEARELVERIKKVTRRRGLRTPAPNVDDEVADPNTVAEYLDNTLDSTTLKQVEETCLGSDVHLAEVAACHQILTLLLTEPARVPPRAHRRMYGLQPAPASTPDRRPNKTLPIGGVGPTDPNQSDQDEADAALLLGMKRYSAATGWAARLAIFGVGAAFLAFLAVAVFMALPQQTPKPPETTPGHSYAQQPAPEVIPPKPKDTEKLKVPKDPDEVAPKPVEVNVVSTFAAAIATEFAATKPNDPGPALNDPVAAPDAKVRDIGRVETSRVLVVAQDRPGSWVRLRLKGDDDATVSSNVALMALPGYKANLLIGDRDKYVQVHLWGNVPEQLRYRVFESRVKFHPPGAGFDADITLLAGRIYLKSKKLDAERKPTGAKVRVRIAGEVWDITLPDEQAQVLIEHVSWFEPGTAYARTAGTPPKAEGRVAVIAGSIGFVAPRRFKNIGTVALNTQLTWDSVSGVLAEPKAISNLQNSTPNPTLPEFQKVVTSTLTDAADKVTDPNVTRQVMEARLESLPGGDQLVRDLTARLAVYSQVALADSSPAGGDTLKPLVDILKSELQWPARQSVVTALMAWVARDRGNTALLRAVFINKGLGAETDKEDVADRLLRLFRGFVSPTKPDPDRLDDLLKWLKDSSIPVREAALWNIVAVEMEAWIPQPVLINVGVGDSDEYGKFLTTLPAKIEMLKKREPSVPLPVPK